MASAEEKKCSEGIEEFVTDLFDYILTKHQFRSGYLEKKFTEQLSLRLLEPKKTKTSPFHEDIGKAVLTTQYLLRDLCLDLFRVFKKNMTRCKKSYLYCVNLTHFICCEFKDGVFMKFIDICAVVVEAFLYCDSIGKPMVEVDEAKVILAGFFEIHVSESFFEKGGWKELRTFSRHYSRTHEFLEKYIHRVNVPYVTLHYDCDLIRFLRESSVPFPVHSSWFCEDCVRSTDSDYCHTFNPGTTSEQYSARYGVLAPPWKKEDEVEDSLSEEEAAGASSQSSLVERKISYVFIGIDEEIREMLEREKKKKKAAKRRQQRKNKKSPKAESECSTPKES